jgi:cytochrome b
MKLIRVYDLPTRLFHATFSLSFIAAFIIAKALDDESAVYGYHMILGMIMAFAVILRIIWGFVGSEHARFKSFALDPKELIAYIKSAVQSKTKKYVGHNPGSSYVALLMFACSLMLVFSGYNMVTKNYKYIFEEVHEIVAHLFLLLSIAHILGIALHTIKHKEIIGLSMLNGNKQVEGDQKTVSNHLIAGIIYVLLLAGVASTLVRNYNLSTGELTLGSKVYNLVKIENDNEHEKEDD